jgi:hypothetical protein
MIQGFMWVDTTYEQTPSNEIAQANEKRNKKEKKGIISQSGSTQRVISKNYTKARMILADVVISSWTLVSEKSGDMQAVQNFIDNPSSLLSLKDEVLKLGYDNKYLTFSKPVKLSFTTQYKNGSKVQPRVQHFWDPKYNTVGLTTNPDAVCSDGVALWEDFDTIIVGKKWLVEFYTCGASLFTMNPAWGTTISNDLKLLVWDCWQAQIYYRGQRQIYNADPPATGCNGTPSAWLRLRVGASDIGNAWAIAWTTQSTVWSTSGNNYTATSSMTALVGWLTYTLTINWNYVAPNTFFTWKYNLTIPTGNTQNVKLYYGMDTTVAWADAADVGYFSTGPTITAWVYDNVANVLSAMRYLTGLTWAGYQSDIYSNISTAITSWQNFNNTTLGTTADFGFGINWNFWTGTVGNFTSTTEWRMTPYVSTNVPDLVAAVGQPTPNLQVNVVSQIPIITTNIGNTGSTGTHTMRLEFRPQISGPTSPFTTNGWSCWAATGNTVTCTKTTSLAPLWTETIDIPLIPLPSASGLTLPFTGSIQNASDSNNTNNTWVTNLFVAVAPAPVDTTPPLISYSGSFSGGILPNGIFTLPISYTNTWTSINTASGDVILVQKWNGATWGANIATWTVNFTGKVLGQSGSTYPITWLSFGRYLVTHSIRDLAGNRGTGTSIFSIDEPSINISTWTLDMGNIGFWTNYFSSQELVITIQTVGAGFNLRLNQWSEFSTPFADQILRWDGTSWFWYDFFPYTSTINSISTGGTLVATQAQSININGLKNTYTYRIKSWVRFNLSEQIAGDYQTDIGFTTLFNY